MRKFKNLTNNYHRYKIKKTPNQLQLQKNHKKVKIGYKVCSKIQRNNTNKKLMS